MYLEIYFPEFQKILHVIAYLHKRVFVNFYLNSLLFCFYQNY